jgi:hypothetical protein
MSATPKAIVDIGSKFKLFESYSYQSQLALLASQRDEHEMNTNTKEYETDDDCVVCREFPCICQKELL